MRTPPKTPAPTPPVRRTLNAGRLAMTALRRSSLHDIEQAVTQVLVAPSAHATKDREYSHAGHRHHSVYVGSSDNADTGTGRRLNADRYLLFHG